MILGSRSAGRVLCLRSLLSLTGRCYVFVYVVAVAVMCLCGFVGTYTNRCFTWFQAFSRLARRALLLRARLRVFDCLCSVVLVSVRDLFMGVRESDSIMGTVRGSSPSRLVWRSHRRGIY